MIFEALHIENANVALRIGAMKWAALTVLILWITFYDTRVKNTRVENWCLCCDSCPYNMKLTEPRLNIVLFVQCSYTQPSSTIPVNNFFDSQFDFAWGFFFLYFTVGNKIHPFFISFFCQSHTGANLQQSLVEGQGTNWKGCKSKTGPHKDKQPLMLSLWKFFILLPINLICIFIYFFFFEKELEYPEKTHAQTKIICRVHPERLGDESATTWLWDNRSNICAVMPPECNIY